MSASPEAGGGSFEFNTDNDTETSKVKKKKTGSQAARLAGLSAESAQNTPPAPVEAPKRANGIDSLLKRLHIGEENRPAAKPESPQAETGALAANLAEASKETKKDARETGALPVGHDSKETPADSRETADASSKPEQALESSETHEMDAEEAAEYRRAGFDEPVELALDGVEGKMQALPLEDVHTPEAAEAAVELDYYRELERQGADASPEELADLPDRAAATVAEHLEAASERDESDEDAEAEDDQRVAAAGAAGGPGSVPPLNPNAPGNTPPSPPNQPPEPPAGGAVPPIPGYPFGAGGPSAPGGPGSPVNPNAPVNLAAPHNFNNLPPSPNNSSESYYDARAAAAQGFLLGGVIGYFIGRHRGRKQGVRRAERQAAPVRKSLERQVQNLQENITAKESQVKALAREKILALQGKKDREKLVNRMLNPTPAEHAPKQAAAPEAVIKPEKLEGHMFDRKREQAGVGRLLGEVPLAAVAIAAPVIMERASERPNASKAGGPEVVPFNKNVKEFTRQELMLTAEKVKVEGTTVKEMVELGRIDEPGLRRVIGEFIRGGDVHRAVIEESKEKDLQFEQDPRFRHGRDQQGEPSPQAVGAGGLIVGSLFGNSPDATDTGSQPPKSADGSKPKPDPATLRDVRNKQIRTVSVTTVLVVLAVVIIILITG